MVGNRRVLPPITQDFVAVLQLQATLRHRLSTKEKDVVPGTNPHRGRFYVCRMKPSNRLVGDAEHLCAGG